MNSTFQLDSHPDAESLNAFAEQALSEREREPILAHLAACSRCRQVIFLAQQAASDLKCKRSQQPRRSWTGKQLTSSPQQWPRRL